MLENTINSLSDFLTISQVIIPNIITLVVITIMFWLTLKGGLNWIGIMLIYTLIMGVLELLGISSVFNLVSVLAEQVDLIGQLI